MHIWRRSLTVSCAQLVGDVTHTPTREPVVNSRRAPCVKIQGSLNIFAVYKITKKHSKLMVDAKGNARVLGSADGSTAGKSDRDRVLDTLNELRFSGNEAVSCLAQQVRPRGRSCQPSVRPLRSPPAAQRSISICKKLCTRVCVFRGRLDDVPPPALERSRPRTMVVT